MQIIKAGDHILIEVNDAAYRAALDDMAGNCTGTGRTVDTEGRCRHCGWPDPTGGQPRHVGRLDVAIRLTSPHPPAA